MLDNIINILTPTKNPKMRSQEEIEILEAWHDTVDAAAERIDEELEKQDVKDSEYWKWHEVADELCWEAAPVLFEKRPADIADREGYTEVECVYELLSGNLNFVNQYYWPLSRSAARQRLAKEGLRLRKSGEDYHIIDAKGKVVANDMCWDQVVRYTEGHRRSGY